MRQNSKDSMINSYKLFFIHQQKKILIYEEMDDDSEQIEFEIYDLIESLNTFTFLKATRVTSADDFVKSLDKRLVGNNVILICSKKMEMEIVE